jgi:hypothetical protein
VSNWLSFWRTVPAVRVELPCEPESIGVFKDSSCLPFGPVHLAENVGQQEGKDKHGAYQGNQQCQGYTRRLKIGDQDRDYQNGRGDDETDGGNCPLSSLGPRTTRFRAGLARSMERTHVFAGLRPSYAAPVRSLRWATSSRVRNIIELRRGYQENLAETPVLRSERLHVLRSELGCSQIEPL